VRKFQKLDSCQYGQIRSPEREEDPGCALSASTPFTKSRGMVVQTIPPSPA
jgi:hypothetical protein